jgi:hypothetical protein
MESYEISYDVAVPKKFTWGAKSLELHLTDRPYTGASIPSVAIRVRPGFDGRNGSGVFISDLANGNYANGDFEVPGFSNDQTLNAVSISVKVNGTALEVWVGQKKVAEFAKAIPPGLKVNRIEFIHPSSDTDRDRYFLTNVKVVKR